MLLGNGDGSFQWVNSFYTNGGDTTQAVAVADFDADGKLDVAVTGNSGFAWGGDVTVLLGRGDGTFGVRSHCGVTGALSVATGDFNHDGKVDLAWADRATAVGVHLGNGDGTFAATALYSATDGSSLFVTVADLNGDGKADLVTGASTDSASVLLGNGDGTFQAARNYAGEGAVVGDFNGDGSLDLAVGTSLLPGYGNDARTFPGGWGPVWGVMAVAGDFNGDGRWDKAVADYGANFVSVQLNDGIWDGPPSPLPPPPPSLRINDVTVTEGNTGTVAATFTVTLSAASTRRHRRLRHRQRHRHGRQRLRGRRPAR